MPMDSFRFTFNRPTIDTVAPDKPGVYSLYLNGNLIYIGSSEVSIRDRLRSHHAGNEGSCTQGASEFNYDLSRAPVARERELLEEYQAANGRLPRCNELIP